MRVVFNFFDQDKKGYIEEKDIKNFLSSSNANEEKKSKLAGAILQEFDANKDKKISFEEFTSKIPTMTDEWSRPLLASKQSAPSLISFCSLSLSSLKCLPSKV